MAGNPGDIDSELRLVVRAAFSAQELRALFGAWGLPPPADAEGTDLARALVRVGTRALGAEELLRRLREQKPLVEWPALPTPPRSPPLDEPTLVDVAPPSRAAPSSGGADAPPAAPPSAQPPLPRGEAWPGLGTDTPARQGAGPSPRTLAVGVGVALAVVAFGAGYAWSRSGAATPAQREGERGLPVAPLALGVLQTELRGVEIGCRLEPRDAASRAILEDAQIECGARRFVPEPVAASAPDAPSVASAGVSPRPTRPPESRPSRLPGVAGASCLGRCSSARTSCESACGPEPRDASHYDSYQSCKSKCASSDSRCRLACP